ncbi:SDR family NAD(P)-dependent oxidoreductase [Nocardia sp. CNY236]|uniref:SDR family NAD(P)-dependent oxidoreductase n=1 Tax=Nocardia sp. CNY236 TaxID=1169152 RepID=UPI0003F99E64|nr:glucose 1-dehydrogenase [Nocardia sp. CNY236]
MDDPVVLITGGFTGIGLATALAFGERGARVVVAGRPDEAGRVQLAKTFAEKLRAVGSEVEFIDADVRHEDEVRAMVDRAVGRFGRLDIAVNNVGTEGVLSAITDHTVQAYHDTFDTNVLGTVLSMKHEVRVMQQQGGGVIVNVSSTYGHAAYGFAGEAGASIYVGSKHAVEGITKSVALELAPARIRVNAVAPGTIDTDMLTRTTGTKENLEALIAQVPLGRVGLADEIAAAIVFLASEDAAFITGHVLDVDGGLTAS